MVTATGGEKRTVFYNVYWYFSYLSTVLYVQVVVSFYFLLDVYIICLFFCDMILLASVCAVQSASTRGAVLRFFALQGRHAALTEVKFGMEPLLHAKFTPIDAGVRYRTQKNAENLTTFLQKFLNMNKLSLFVHRAFERELVLMILS